MYRIEDITLQDTLGGLLNSKVTGDVQKSDDAFAAIKSFQSSFKQISRTPAMIRAMLQLEFKFVGVVDASAMKPPELKSALRADWYQSVFVVVDYSNVEEWLEKCHAEAAKGKCVVAMVPSRTSTNWFHEMVLESAKEVRFVKGRVTLTGKSQSSSTPDALVIFDEVNNKRRKIDTSAAFVMECASDIKQTGFGLNSRPNP